MIPSFRTVQQNKISRTAAVISGLLLVALTATLPAAAQTTRPRRRESNANRKARIARTIAQTYGHRWEAGGGGGFMRFRSGLYQQQANQVTFWASTMYALNPKLGVAAEIRGEYGKAKLGNNQFGLGSPGFGLPAPQISEYQFMAGPSYRFLRREKLSVSGFAEAGLGLGKFAGGAKGLTAADIGVWTGDYAAAFTVGAHIDYNLYPNLAVRLTPNYLGTTYGGTLQNSKGVNVGVVYRFGQIK